MHPALVVRSELRANANAAATLANAAAFGISQGEIGDAGMRATTSVMFAGGLALVLWGGVSGSALLARAEPGPAKAPIKVAQPLAAPPPTDADRRAELNARMQAMLAQGKGGRLKDAPPPSRARSAPRAASSVRPARASASSGAAIRPAVLPLNEPASSIVPPAYDPSRAPVVSGRGYTPPRLDLKRMPVVPSNPIECLTQAIYYEARNESEEGQAAVAEVVLNRANSGRYPRDVCQVVYQRNTRTCQFTFTCDGSIGRSAINMRAWARAERIARGVYAGESKSLLPRSSVNYHANYVRPTWSRRLARVRQIGAHIFYGSPLNGGATPGAEPPPPPRSLLFVKNDAIERAYALLTGRSASSPEPAKNAS